MASRFLTMLGSEENGPSPSRFMTMLGDEQPASDLARHSAQQLPAPPTSDWRDAEARANLAAIQGPRPITAADTQPAPSSNVATGTILPMSRNLDTGKVSPAVPGLVSGFTDAAKDAYNLPGDVYTGKVDPNSPEAVGREVNFAALGTPLSRAGKGVVAGTNIGKPAPSKELIRAESKLNYMKANQAGVVFTPDSIEGLVAGLTHKLSKEGIDPTLHPKASAAMGRFVKVVDKPQTDEMARLTGTAARPAAKVSLEEVDTLRQIAGDASRSIEPADRRLGVIIRDRVDDYLDTIKPEGVAAGNAKEAIDALKAARAGWAKMRKAETIDEMMETAGITAGQFSISGKENAIRTQFRALAKKIVKDKREAARWAPDERKLIKQLGNMGSAVNLLRTLGKLSPNGTIPLGVNIGIGAVGGPALGIASATAGMAGKFAARRLTERKVNQLSELVRGGVRAPNALARAKPGNALMYGAEQNWLQDRNQQ